jgi:hypothetical protein
MIRGLALTVVYITCVAFGSHEAKLHILAIAFWPSCSGPPDLQKETWRSEVELLILLMGACHVGSM